MTKKSYWRWLAIVAPNMVTAPVIEIFGLTGARSAARSAEEILVSDLKNYKETKV